MFYFFTLAILFLLSACTGENNRKHDTTCVGGGFSVVSTSEAEKPIVDVYVENSASMDGYVEGVTEFEQTIYSYLSDIKISDYSDSLNLFYINSQMIRHKSDIADFIEKLEPTTFRKRGGNRSATDISNIFRAVLAKIRKNDVAILVTDGIFSSGKGKNAQEYLVNQQIGIKNTMAECLKKNPNTALVLYQLSSKFNGKFYNREDKPTVIKDKQRPYYIWIIGDVDNIARLKMNIPETNFKGNGIQHSFTILPSIEKEVNYMILSNPKTGSFDRQTPSGFGCSKKKDYVNPKTSIYNIKKANKGIHKGTFMFATGMDLSLFSVLLGDEYLMNAENYILLINKQVNNDYSIEIEYNTNPYTNYTHNMKLTTDKISVGELEINLRSRLPDWISEINDNEGLDIYKNDAINKTFGIKYLVEGIYEAYQMRGNTIYTTMKFNLKK